MVHSDANVSDCNNIHLTLYKTCGEKLGNRTWKAFEWACTGDEMWAGHRANTFISPHQSHSKVLRSCLVQFQNWKTTDCPALWMTGLKTEHLRKFMIY
jgi:hypothetical protein